MESVEHTRVSSSVSSSLRSSGLGVVAREYNVSRASSIKCCAESESSSLVWLRDMRRGSREMYLPDCCVVMVVCCSLVRGGSGVTLILEEIPRGLDINGETGQSLDMVCGAPEGLFPFRTT